MLRTGWMLLKRGPQHKAAVRVSTESAVTAGRRRTGERHPARAVPLVPGVGRRTAAAGRIDLHFLEGTRLGAGVAGAAGAEHPARADFGQTTVVVRREDVAAAGGFRGWGVRQRAAEDQDSQSEADNRAHVYSSFWNDRRKEVRKARLSCSSQRGLRGR